MDEKKFEDLDSKLEVILKEFFLRNDVELMNAIYLLMGELMILITHSPMEEEKIRTLLRVFGEEIISARNKMKEMSAPYFS